MQDPKPISADEPSMAAQLRCPSGTQAGALARHMNESHGSLNRHCIAQLQLQPGDQVLETGPGNGAFASEIVAAASGVRYVGIDWSEAMVQQAKTRHAGTGHGAYVEFMLGNSDRLPFDAQRFDKALTVHTIYFWEDPRVHLRELARVLKPGGLLCLACADRAFAERMAFGRMGFRLYGAHELTELLQQAGFELLQADVLVETGTLESGESIDKLLHVLVCARARCAGGAA